ncbi:hypothetical protein GCM10009760_47880 [Kitasatospora kazusensis]|uniref:non-specific serine/threonine protein kinase n=1 Tax=Kitasatospora kazusensis TaxID=407974 RepID=A0ABP5LQK4_9ACTN
MEHAQAVGGRYLVDGLLGHGGMAEVHRARDLRLDRVVAVKVLRPELAADPAYRERFGREARSAAALNHPGIVAVFDSGEGAGPGADLPYIVMEHLRGETLAELVRDGRAPGPEGALLICAEILDALAHAHRSGTVHRDIKPANVMVTDRGVVKVMDFGIARPLDPAAGVTLTGTGMVLGTAEYLSPEQARGRQVDARSDLYSTGCLLYELLTSRPPFRAETPLATVWLHLEEAPAPPSRYVPGLPAAVDALVLTALAKEPDRRFADAASMRAAVGRALRELRQAVPAPGTAAAPTAATPTAAARAVSAAPTLAAAVPAPSPAPSPTPARRRRMPRVALVLLGCAVLAGGGVAIASARGGAAATVPAPDLRGKTLAEARRTLQGAGLHVGRIATGDCAVPVAAGRAVCGQQPVPGAGVTRGGAVALRIPADPAAVR